MPNGPRFGDQIIGSESNAVAFYNSVIGARTQKYGDFLDVCCALTGRVPYTGLHDTTCRRGQVTFDVSPIGDDDLKQESTAALIGHIIGQRAGSQIPVIDGYPVDLPKDVMTDYLKAIAAAGAASGGISLFHVIGITPEAPDAAAAYQGHTPLDRIMITPEDIERAQSELSTVTCGPLNMVALGTPHFSLSEFRRLTDALKGRKVHPDVTVYVSTARFTAALAEQEGLLVPLKTSGITVLTDTCTYFSPAVQACQGNVMTNSAKWAFYGPGMLPIRVCFASLEACVTSAIKGEIMVQGDHA